MSEDLQNHPGGEHADSVAAALAEVHGSDETPTAAPAADAVPVTPDAQISNIITPVHAHSELSQLHESAQEVGGQAVGSDHQVPDTTLHEKNNKEDSTSSFWEGVKHDLGNDLFNGHHARQYHPTNNPTDIFKNKKEEMKKAT